MAQNAGNQVLNFKSFRGSIPTGPPPRRPVGFTFGPVGAKVIENPVKVLRKLGLSGMNLSHMI
ncbi:hypothetical protein DPMN_181557 [Dreissena polymorpha]|uniref:Uncharacterized protein n=1 Tax=Dreissena polymorpha TaxID=45954 RepID=A0A9D4DEP4_DREPO|nr:hypothetical protein DPMN_181557 [Dreissena polymorpha]